MKTKAKIIRVWIERKPDETPDTSYLGEYTNKINSGWRLSREEGKLYDESANILADDVPSNYGHCEYRYIAGFQYTGNPKNWAHVSGEDVNKSFFNAVENGDFERFKIVGWKDAKSQDEKIRCMDILNCCQDCERLYHLERNDWCYIGIIAKCEIVVPRDGTGDSIIQTIHSGGIWGIESDSGKDYLEEEGRNQLAELRAQLKALGIGDRAIDHAFKDVRTVDR